MRILLWHGYLLGGTGSNVYTRGQAGPVQRPPEGLFGDGPVVS